MIQLTVRPGRVTTADLHGYDLKEVLRRGWSSAAQHSAPMAALRLRLARDPAINDRINQRGNPELCALLDCGVGLTALPADDFVAAATELGPNHLLGCAEFAEVVWRAGRPADAATVMRAVADAIPDQPAYDSHRSITQILIDAADLDTAAKSETGVRDASEQLIASADAVPRSAGDFGANLVRQVKPRATARFLLAGLRVPAGLAVQGMSIDDGATDPADAAQQRANSVAAVGKELEAISQTATATGRYLRLFARLYGVAAHLLRCDAAELRADVQQAGRTPIGPQRRAALLEAELTDKFAADDPLASGLQSALAAVGRGNQCPGAGHHPRRGHRR